MRYTQENQVWVRDGEVRHSIVLIEANSCLAMRPLWLERWFCSDMAERVT